MIFKNLKQKFQSHAGHIGILGLGYVGLPLACEFGKAGYPVTGFEVDASKVKVCCPAALMWKTSATKTSKNCSIANA